MSEDFAQLDELIESDLREALGEPALEQGQEDDVMNIPEELIDLISEPIIVEDNEVEQDGQGEVLDDIGDIEILPMAEIESALEDEDEDDSLSSSTVNSVNTSDLATLLSQLLNNKTIEITIKIKD